MIRRILPAVLLLVAFASVRAQNPKDAPPKDALPKEDLDTLKAVNLKADAASLLDYLRKQTHPEADPKLLLALVGDLGDDVFQTREIAYAKLITLGRAAISGVKEAERDSDPEIKLRAGDLRRRLEAKVEPAIQTASVRLLARLKPAGTSEALLSFLPFAADMSTTEEVCRALDAIAVEGSTMDPALVTALENTKPIRRAAAAQAILLAKNGPYRDAARNLLKDAEPLVRVRVGLALVKTRDAQVVGEVLPVLIECLQHLPPDSLWAVEDILIRLAGEGKAPTVSLGTNEKSRLAAFNAWNEWYGKNRKEIAVARLDQTESHLGRTLIVFHNANRINVNGGMGIPGGIAINGRFVQNLGGELIEVDKNKNVLWQLKLDDCFPVDAQVVPDRLNEVVVAEYRRATNQGNQEGRISVRDTMKKGNAVIWEQAVGGNPIGVQALAEGKFFVVLLNRLLIVDRATKAVRVVLNQPVLNQPGHDIYRAKVAKNGDIVYVTNNGTCVRLNADGNQVKQFQVPVIPTLQGNIDVLANGNVVIPDFQQKRVVEYDTNGTQVSQIATEWPSCAVRLPNGNTLVASQNAPRVIEFSREGHEVWSHAVEGNVFSIRRR